MGTILIAGSRSIVGQAFYDIMYDFVGKFSKDTIIVSGMADGTDLYAHHAAVAHGLFVKEFPIDDEEWKRFGKRAGYVRNFTMGAYISITGGEAFLFVNNGVMTAGTGMMKSVCKTFNIPYTTIYVALDEDVLSRRVSNWRRERDSGDNRQIGSSSDQ